MNKTDKLRSLMAFNAEMTSTEIELRYEQIAKILFENFAIQKGEELYLFKEIEFYFYNRNHRDIITHPRNSNPLCWYINDFGGIDLTFPSKIDSEYRTNGQGKLTCKYILDDNAFFGGILIRQLISIDGIVMNGPWACAELFRSFDATNCCNQELPFLIVQDNGIVAATRASRINLLSAKQSVEKKVDNILYGYHQHPESNELYKQFEAFINQPYRFIRCENLIHDESTNVVYFSSWLKDKKEGFPKFYNELTNLLQSIGIESKELKNTQDYWARDYMPIQLGSNEFLKYTYRPDYLASEPKLITDVNRVIAGMGLCCRKTDLVIDGGNIVACGPFIVMTDKVFTENGREKGDTNFIKLLEAELGHPVIIIPWKLHGDTNAEDTDKYGHADGFNKWCGDNRILMGNHGDEYPDEAAKISKILENHGFVVTEIRFNDKVASPRKEYNWAYINFLQIGTTIVIPKFGIDEDAIAYEYIHHAFPKCTIYQIEMNDIVKKGGALHCLSWNICKHK